MKKLTIIALLLVLLTACTTNHPGDITIEMTDFAFTPNHYQLTAGETVTLTIEHDGYVEHDLVIMKLGADVGAHFNADDLPNVLWQANVQPGDTQTVTFTVPSEPGTYQVVCGMAGHVEAGMIGELVVVE